MRTKTLEIRDRATRIHVVAIKPGHLTNSIEELTIAGINGYSLNNSEIILVKINDGTAKDRVQNWNDRTMYNAHKFIQENFETLKDGEVIDVEFILGESEIKKQAEWIAYIGETEW